MGFTHYFAWVALPGAIMGTAESLIATPFISALWNGSFGVCIFFVLSGYVLTRSFCATGNMKELQAGAIRRYVRLSLPILGSVLFSYILISAFGKPFLSTVQVTKSAWLASQIPATPSLLGATRQGLFDALFYRDRNSYNGALWSMSVEFVGSMLIYAYRALAGLGILNNIVGSVIYIAITVVYAPDIWPYLLAFLLGTHLNSLPRFKSRVMATLLALSGLFLGSYDGSPLFAPISTAHISPELAEMTTGVVGGALIVYAALGGAFDRILQAAVPQFLGRISFPLYLIHLPLIATLSCYLFNFLITGHQNNRGLVVVGVLALTLPPMIAISWYFERIIDRPAIALGRTFFPKDAGARSSG